MGRREASFDFPFPALAGKGLGVRVFDRLCNRPEHRDQIVAHLMISEAQHSKTEPSEVIVTHSIVALLPRVLTTVEFNRQSCAMRIKIYDIRAQWLLAPKMCAEPVAAQFAP